MRQISSLEYRPEIDGLRAIAVVAVIFYHFDVTGFSGGYVGVDVFFVLSGYLIASIILNDIQRGSFSIWNFYQRRVRRIFPALFAVTIFTMPAALIILVPKDLENFGQSVIAIGFFVQNFLFFSEDVYFGGPAELKPLLHTWSLAVEEQFYLFFPLLCILVVKFRANYLPIFVVLGVLSLGFSEWLVRLDASAAFYLLPSRIWELLLGSSIALLTLEKIPYKGFLSVVGVVMLCLSIGLFEEMTQFPGLSALLPCIGTGLLVISLRPGNLIYTTLTQKPVVFMGLISYSLYLWHFPISAFAKRLLGRDFVFYEQASMIAASVFLAFVSWRYIERPFRGQNSVVTNKQLGWFSAGCVLTVLSFGIYTDLADGAWGRFSPETQKILMTKKAEKDECLRQDSCVLGTGEPVVAVWGDSHVNSIISPFRFLSETTGLTTEVFAYGGCLPLIGYRPGADAFGERCRNRNEQTLERILESTHRTVFLHGRWTLAVEGSKFKYEHGPVPPVLAYPDTGENKDRLTIVREALEKTIQELEQHGKQIVVVGPMPEAGWDVPYALAQRFHFKGIFDQNAANPTWSEYLTRNQPTLDMLSEVVENSEADVSIVFPHDKLCRNGIDCRIEIDLVPLYIDAHHVTPTGANLLYDLLAPYYSTEQAVGSP